MISRHQNQLNLFCSASFVVFLLIIRDKRGVDMLPATCLSGIVMGGVAGFCVESFAISNHDLVIAITMGCLQFGIGFWHQQ